jgi:cytochrome c-type biogenesis protein CcmE
MTRKQKRLSIIVGCLTIAGFAIGLILFAMRDTIVFFYTPSEITQKSIPNGTRIRLGGLVEKGSLVRVENATVTFRVTDMIATLNVKYVGQLPDLFREGQGVVAEGAIAGDGVFAAETVLAKHDEKYMPKEISDKLKEKGVWKENVAAVP